MPSDFAIWPLTGDLVFSSNFDYQLVVNEQTVDQRMRVRLRIDRDSFEDDPSGGYLGSYLKDIFHLPRKQAIEEAELYVRQALEPMTDITITDIVVTEDPDTQKSLKLTISYFINEEEDDIIESENPDLIETLTIEVPV